MVKKQNNINWLTWVLAIIAIMALILAVVALNKANMTGNAFWDFFKREKVQIEEQTEYNGFLVGEYANSEEYSYLLKGYQARYDKNGRLIYEVLDNEVWSGEDYNLIDSSGDFSFKSKLDGSIQVVFLEYATAGKKCKCVDNPPAAGAECVKMFPFGCVSKYGGDKKCNQCEKEATT